MILFVSMFNYDFFLLHMLWIYLLHGLALINMQNSSTLRKKWQWYEDNNYEDNNCEGNNYASFISRINTHSWVNYYMSAIIRK